jgi:hypothetical protein
VDLTLLSSLRFCEITLDDSNCNYIQTVLRLIRKSDAVKDLQNYNSYRLLQPV